MKESLQVFTQKNSAKGIEDDFSGLFWLLRIAKEPSNEIIS
jgi:hypothetical protein